MSKASLHFATVAVPAGEHEVVIRYASRWWRGPLLLTGWLLFCVVAWVEERRHRLSPEVESASVV